MNRLYCFQFNSRFIKSHGQWRRWRQREKKIVTDSDSSEDRGVDSHRQWQRWRPREEDSHRQWQRWRQREEDSHSDSSEDRKRKTVTVTAVKTERKEDNLAIGLSLSSSVVFVKGIFHFKFNLLLQFLHCHSPQRSFKSLTCQKLLMVQRTIVTVSLCNKGKMSICAFV